MWRVYFYQLNQYPNLWTGVPRFFASAFTVKHNLGKFQAVRHTHVKWMPDTSEVPAFSQRFRRLRQFLAIIRDDKRVEEEFAGVFGWVAWSETRIDPKIYT